MKKSIIIVLLILTNLIKIVINKKVNKSSKKKQLFNAVYRIDSLKNGLSLSIENNQLLLSNKKEGKEEHFRIRPSNSNSNLYYIQSSLFNLFLGVNDKDEIILYNKNDTEIVNEIYWNIIKINKKEFLIQNNYTKKFIEYDNYILKCSDDLTELINIDNIKKNNISNFFKFSFLKLYEEVELKPKHINIIEKEPIDVVIKYIDLTDTTLNREGIKQSNKDFDNEELRYCIRSILEYIPWIRKIFILMPNEKVKYFKPKNEIKEKIIYIKDKDLLGFDCSDSHTFQFNLFKMKNYGLSENFILMDDDYFFGKPINKSQFFYYDEKQKKVLPNIITDEFNEIMENETIKEYNKLFSNKYMIKPYSLNCFKLQKLATFKLLLEQYKKPLINAGFTHNAIALNLNDIKEIYELIKNKYEYSYEVLFSKDRSILGLQSHSLFNSYALNIKKRKVNIIPYGYYDIGNLEDKNLDIEMFVINNAGGRLYEKLEYEKEKIILDRKFNKPTPYEIISYNISDNNINNEKLNELIQKDNKDKENNELNKTVNDLNFNRNKNKENNTFIIFGFVLLFFLVIIFIYIVNLTYFISSKNSSNNSSIDKFQDHNSYHKKSKKKYSEDEKMLFQ